MTPPTWAPDPRAGPRRPSGPEAPPDPGFPPDVALALDRRAQLTNGERTLIGGDPPRALRLSEAGATVLARLCVSGAGASVAARRLARTLTDAGLAHPQPQPDSDSAAREVTVVVPVRDRPDALDRCLAATLGTRPDSDQQPAGPKVVVVDDGSRDPNTVAEICRRYNARLLRIPISSGPAAARNAALTQLDTPLVAFLDSDCVPARGWINALAGHFDDPLVAAVAPRVRGSIPSNAGPIGRFAAARSPLDLGHRPARVLPGGRASYVPTAALLVRTAALGEGFDPRLRYGEDVDLVWRLHDAGWRIRYEPAVTVRHAEPTRWRALAARRFHYGTSAAPLALRHPGRLAPLILPRWTALAGALALADQPWLSANVFAFQVGRTVRRLRPLGLPTHKAAALTLRSATTTTLAAARAIATLAPAPLLAAVTTRRSRFPAAVLIAAPPLVEWVRRRPRLDPLRWTALSLADDAAYGAGVWTGSLHNRSPLALRPTLTRPPGLPAKRA